MELSREFRPCLVWSPQNPDQNGSTGSPPFYLKKQRCHLTLFRDTPMGYSYSTFSLRIETDRGDQSDYRTSVALEQRNVTGLSTSGVFGRCRPSPQTIWEYTLEEIQETFPGICNSNNPLKFVLSFFSTTPGEDDKRMEPTLECTQSETVATQTSFHVPCLESLSEDLSKYLDEDSCQDVELKCGDQIVKAHGKFLGTRSRVFAAMLQSDMTEGRTGIVEVRDMDPEVFRCFIRYIYTGQLPQLTIETARCFYEAGDKYELERLTRRCADFLKQNVSPANACDLLVLADAHRDLNFKDEVVTYILAKKIPLQDDLWRSFCDCHPRLANEVLNRSYKMQNEMHQPSKN